MQRSPARELKRDEAEPSERAQKKVKTDGSSASKLRCQMVLPSTAYSNYRTRPLIRMSKLSVKMLDIGLSQRPLSRWVKNILD